MFKHSPNALLVPARRKFALFHFFLRRRRRSAFKSLRPEIVRGDHEHEFGLGSQVILTDLRCCGVAYGIAANRAMRCVFTGVERLSATLSTLTRSSRGALPQLESRPVRSSAAALVRQRRRRYMPQLVRIAHHVQRTNHVAVDLERRSLHRSSGLSTMTPGRPLMVAKRSVKCSRHPLRVAPTRNRAARSAPSSTFSCRRQRGGEARSDKAERFLRGDTRVGLVIVGSHRPVQQRFRCSCQ